MYQLRQVFSWDTGLYCVGSTRPLPKIIVTPRHTMVLLLLLLLLPAAVFGHETCLLLPPHSLATEKPR